MRLQAHSFQSHFLVRCHRLLGGSCLRIMSRYSENNSAASPDCDLLNCVRAAVAQSAETGYRFTFVIEHLR